jgi:hypothetical protein
VRHVESIEDESRRLDQNEKKESKPNLEAELTECVLAQLVVAVEALSRHILVEGHQLPQRVEGNHVREREENDAPGPAQG